MAATVAPTEKPRQLLGSRFHYSHGMLSWLSRYTFRALRFRRAWVQKARQLQNEGMQT